VDQVIYELHVRDFSVNDAKVPAAHRGTYLAFTDSGGEGMQHLRALARAGLTDVHLLPVFDIATIPEVGCTTPEVSGPPAGEEQQAIVARHAANDCFNWGYDPLHYTVPEGSYATDAHDPGARTREFRRMVMALERAGLRVGMDVVYNHTSAAGQAPQSVLDRIVPGYYHRLDAQGRVERSTCCDNTATEHAMMAKLMIESAVRWVRYYKIDSFRFDLMGHQPRWAMERLQVAVDSAAGRHIPLVGEGWNFGEIANGARFVQASQLSLQGSGIATFSDRARDALRGGGCCDGGEGLVANQGLLNGLHYAPNAMNSGKDRRGELLHAADLARVGLAGTLRDYELTGADGLRRPLSAFNYAGGPAGYAQEPGEVVNYVENHDNLTLFDLNAMRLPRDLSREERARAQMLGVAFTAFSQGVAYFHAGVEVLRSKSLDRNSFNSGDWFNRLDWSYRDNGFGAGLPRAEDNRNEWPFMKAVLADARIKPTSREIRWMRDASLDLLRIRSSSTLFRLRTAADVQRRLRFVNVGPSQNPVVIGALLDGNGYAGARFKEVLYFINVAGDAQELTVPEAAGRAWTLHPVHRSARAADARAKEAQIDTSTGRLRIPARTAVVFVRE
jgi:pullulanase-type alpha-1,6-glucosidase